MEVIGRGIIQFIEGNKMFASNGHKLYFSIDKNWKLFCKLPVSIIVKFISSITWLSRLTRYEVYHFQKINMNCYVCFGFKNIFLINTDGSSVKKIGAIRGSRPLCICCSKNRIYYGVYKGNKNRGPIELYCYSTESNEWETVYTFNGIRHIHGVFWDHYESTLWVTTGDLDEESAIWRFNESNIPEKIVYGSQQARAVELIFTKESIFFGTDAPNDLNFIYKIDRKSKQAKKLQSIGGPTFYGYKTTDDIFFSTVVEPSTINRTDAVEIWGSDHTGENWKLIKELKKDFLPFKLFQYGQIKFPSLDGEIDSLIFSPFATEKSHKIIKLNKSKDY